MNTTIRCLLVAASIAGVAASGSAQLVNSATNAAASVRPVVPPMPPPAAASFVSAASHPDIAAAQGINATVNTAATTTQIQQATFESRKQLSADIEARIEMSEKALANLMTRANAASDRARDDLARAMRNVHAKEKELRASLRIAVKSAKESTWGEVQAKLAQDYSAYADAVVAASAAVDGSASATEPKS